MRLVHVYASNIISPFHRAGVMAFLRAFSSEGTAIKALIMVEPGNWSLNLLELECVTEPNLTVEMVYNSPRVKFLSLLKALYALFFWRDPSSPNCLVVGHSRVNIKLLAHLISNKILNRKVSFATVVFDEGIGSYGRLPYRFGAFCRENNPNLLKKLQYLLIYPLNQFFLKWEVLIDFDWRLLKKCNGKYLTSNASVIDSYREYFEKDAKNIIPSQPYKHIFLVTQPLVELGLMDKDEYRIILDRLRNSLKKYGLSLALKIHPAESKNFYLNAGFDLIESKLPAETIICNMKPLIVIGFSSTALINSQLISDIPSLSLVSILINSSFSSSIFSNDREVASIFKEYVKIPGSWKELDNYLEELAS